MSVGLPTAEDLRQWRKERDRLAAEEHDIKRRKAQLDKLIDAGKAFVGEGRRDVSKAQRAAPALSKTAEVPKIDRKTGKSWTETMKEIAQSAERALTYQELKEEVGKTHLGKRLRETEAAFYGAIGKLSEKEEIVRYKGHVFSPEAYARFSADLKAGKIPDIKEPRGSHRSPIRDAIFKLLENYPRGRTTAQIIEVLQKNPDTVEAVKKNKTPVYNLLSRLTKRRDIMKRGKKYQLPPSKNKAPGSEEPGALDRHGDGGGTPSSPGNGMSARSSAAFPDASPAHPGV